MNDIDFFKNLETFKLKKTINHGKRYLLDKIDWNLPLIIILGARGTGKTTLMLQKAATLNPKKSIYLSLDYPYFEGNRLYKLVESFYMNGGRSVFLDEVHKYEHWAKDIKHLTDTYDGLKLVVTGSSAIEISKQKADLSRRSVVFNLPGLSIREFILFDKNIHFPVYTLNDILKNHVKIASEISEKIDIIKVFSNYLKHGYYPFFSESKQYYNFRLAAAVTHLIESDLPPIFKAGYKTVRNLKKLLYILAQEVSFKPNITKLAQRMEINRNQVLQLLDNLNDAELINLLKTDSLGFGYLTKPEKVYLNNPNLSYALSDIPPAIGTIRESFFYNQLKQNHKVTAPKYGDFLVDEELLFEVGGENKAWNQIKNLPSSHFAIDGITVGNGNRIPLWLFGFMY